MKSAKRVTVATRSSETSFFYLKLTPTDVVSWMAQVVDARARGIAEFLKCGFDSPTDERFLFLSKRPLNKTCTVDAAKINC